MTKPVPSQYSSFSRSARFDLNTKTVRVDGSLRSSGSTNAARPSCPLRKSTGLVAITIRTRCDGNIMRMRSKRGKSWQCALLMCLHPAAQYGTMDQVQRRRFRCRHNISRTTCGAKLCSAVTAGRTSLPRAPIPSRDIATQYSARQRINDWPAYHTAVPQCQPMSRPRFAPSPDLATGGDHAPPQPNQCH